LIPRGACVKAIKSGVEHAQVENQAGCGEAFSQTANGFKRGQSHRRHILTKKPSKRKRQLRRESQVHETDVNRIKVLLPHA